jgi:cobalt-zinc-cadmium efflux system membrane fusion protein
MKGKMASLPSGLQPSWRFKTRGSCLAVIAAAWLSGCDRPAAGRPQATVRPGAAADDHDHDHGDPEHPDHGPAAGDPDEAHASEVRLTQAAIRRHGIRIARAKTQTLDATLTAPARLAYNAEQVAHIGSVVTGRVEALKVRLGDTVQKGDVLLVVDSPELGQSQSEFLQRRAAIAVAKPAVELAQSAYDRARELFEKSQGIPLTELQKRLGELRAAQGSLLAAETALTAAENKLHLLGMDREAVGQLANTGRIDPRYTVRAPISGQVIDREATLGELVRPETEKLMVLADLSTVWVLADVPEAKLGEIALGSQARVTLPALANRDFMGAVSYISPELDLFTRTARVRIEVKNPEGRLLPGMFARVEVSTVPEDALQTVDGQPAVFVPVAGESSAFRKQPVTAGPPVSGMVPIHSGLEEGAPYVVSGTFILKAELGKTGAEHEH